MKQTPLFNEHTKASGKMVDFSGWHMPLHYGSQIKEHNIVRHDAGMFDVSHMTIVDVIGDAAKPFLRYLLANDVAKLAPGKAMYSCMLNERGGIIDDLILYYFDDQFYRLIVNSSTREKDIAWITRQASPFAVDITEQTGQAIIAIQGPQAIAKTITVLNDSQTAAVEKLTPFSASLVEDWLFARTGYTGEDGLEIILPAKKAESFWQALLDAGIQPCGLGARDSLRLEAGMGLYGQDMDETVTPFESGIAWTVALSDEQRDFIGRDALLAQQKEGPTRQLVGLILKARGVMRHRQAVILTDGQLGYITSGGFSPMLKQSIAFARVPATIGTDCLVDIRGKQLPAQVVKLPFVRQGNIVNI